jgi:hypothetical protein
VSDSGELVPRLANRFERLSGGAYRLHLREGARFSDGAPVRDQDLVASLAEAALSVRREGEWLVVEPKRKEMRADVQLARAAVARNVAGHWVGTGPFAMVEQSQRRMLLRRTHPSRGRIETVELLSADTPDDAFARTLAGEADALPNVPPRMIEFFEGVPHLKLLRGPSLYAEAVVFNARTMGRELRAALRRDLPMTDAKDVGSRDRCVAFPPEAGRALPLPDGPPLRAVAQVQDHTAQKLGLAVRRWLGTRSRSLAVLDLPDLAAAVRTGDFDLALTRLLLQPRGMAAMFFRTGAPNNFARYSNAAVDAAFDADDWPAAQAALAADPPVVYLCSPERLAVVDSRFKNARLGPYGLFETLPDWEAAP